MIKASDVEQRIGKILLEGMSLDVPSLDTDLIGEGILDSMTFIDLLQRLEEEFGIRIQLDEMDLDHFRSIPQMAAFVARLAAASAA
jgi:acyl carrier protein